MECFWVWFLLVRYLCEGCSWWCVVDVDCVPAPDGHWCMYNSNLCPWPWPLGLVCLYTSTMYVYKYQYFMHEQAKADVYRAVCEALPVWYLRNLGLSWYWFFNISAVHGMIRYLRVLYQVELIDQSSIFMISNTYTVTVVPVVDILPQC